MKMAITNTPNVSNALYPAYVGLVKDDPRTFSVDPVNEITGNNYVSLENEILAHQQALVSLGGTSGPNLLANASFDVWQRKTTVSPTGIANGAYGPDRWYLLTDDAGTDITVNQSQQTLTAGNFNTLQIVQTAVASKKIAFCQVVEVANTIGILNQNLTFSLNALTNATASLRLALCVWTGTPDAPLHSFIADWTHSADADPTTNFITGSTLRPIAWTGAKVLSGTDQYIFTPDITTATAANLVVIAWTPTAIATSTSIYLSQSNLVVRPAGFSLAPKYLQRQIAEEMVLCQRYFEKSFPPTVPPAPGASFTGAITTVMTWATALPMWVDVKYQVVKMKNPIVMFYNPYSANALWYGSGSADSGAADTWNAGLSGFQASNDGTGTYTQGKFANIQWSADAEFY
jgi:hypothetical protein